MSLFTEQLPAALGQQNDLQRAIHRPHWEERLEILHALAAAYTKPLKRQASQLAACGETARLWYDPEAATVRTLIHRCKNRICPWCTHARTAKAVRQILRVMKHMENPRSVVLTARSNDRPLAEQITDLKRAFVQLRRNKTWKRFVNGGIYVLEITWNPQRQQWHPHVHVITDGTFFPQPLLSKLWAAATGGSDIVWIKAVPDHEKAAIELAGYIGKPPKIKTMSHEAIRQYAASTRGLRMLQTFGRLHNLHLDDADEDFSIPKGTQCITVNRIRFLANRGQPQAQLLAHWIPIRWPIFRGFFAKHTDADSRPPPKLLPDQIQEISETITPLFLELAGQQDTGMLEVYDIQHIL